MERHRNGEGCRPKANADEIMEFIMGRPSKG